MKMKSNLEIYQNSHNFDEVHEKSMKDSFLSVLKDYSIYLHVILFISIVAPSYGISLFLPSVIHAMGYSSSESQLLTIPIYFVAAACAIIQAKGADKVGVRFIFITINMSIVCVGFIMAIVGQESDQPKVIYAGVFVGMCGLFPAFQGMITWNANNLANTRKRALGMAFQIGFGNFGGVFAANFYITSQLTMGHSLELGFAFLGVITSLVLADGNNYSIKKNLQRIENGGGLMIIVIYNYIR